MVVKVQQQKDESRTEIALTQVQNLALGLVEPHVVLMVPLITLSPAQLPCEAQQNQHPRSLSNSLL